MKIYLKTSAGQRSKIRRWKMPLSQTTTQTIETPSTTSANWLHLTFYTGRTCIMCIQLQRTIPYSISAVQCDSLEWSYTIRCIRAVGKSILELCSVPTNSSQWGTTSSWQTVFQSLLQCSFSSGLLLRANADHSCISINSYIPHVGNHREYLHRLMIIPYLGTLI